MLAMNPDIQLCRDLMNGTKAMREAAERNLPRWPNEDAETYAARLAISTLFPAYSRTVQTLAAKPFSRPITYGEDVPASLREMMDEDADLMGNNLDVFAARVLETALAYGLAGIMVEAPVAPVLEDGRVLTQAEEKALGIRPYLILVYPWNILGWRSQSSNGVMRLTMLRLREYVTEEDGEFGEKLVEQVRVLTPGAWATYRKNERGEWVPNASGATNLTEIPFRPVYGQYIDFMVGKPPMLEMAHLNVKHWQSQSDQDNLLHVARVPILVIAGVNDERFKLTIGASEAVRLPTGATAGFVEHSGAAIGAGRIALEDLKEEMRQAGAELLVLQPGVKTATQVGTENAVGMCALQRIAESVEDALDGALQLCAEMGGLGDGGHVTLFKDFGAATLAEAGAQLLVAMNQSGSLSKKTLLTEIKRRGILSADVDVDDELDAASSEGPPNGEL